ncbi:hypothetical protein B7990_11810 [Fibrobacter sp. UWB4]|nr:hypothetical protein B7990_11810 [Fibrobacter sp. UWB4]
MGYVLMFFCLLAYFFISLKFYGFSYGTGFTETHGFNLLVFGMRWTNYALTTVMSVSLIAIMPNKKYWFTQYGTRTMNVYLLHMSIVFPVCWCFLRPFMHCWYGYVSYAVLVPLFVIFLCFSDFVDKEMKKVLLVPKRLFLRKW